MKLEELQKDAVVTGIEPGQVVRIVAVEAAGAEAVSVYYKKSDGKLGERLLFRGDESSLSPAVAGRPWAFDAPGEDFKLVTEAVRIHWAYLFDPMMAVHTSNVEPLPHQLTAVYEAMLPRQPLRFVLADDPGAGKTIMAGLFIRELILRADARRVLIVSPGSLVEQWQDELHEKFGLSFSLFSREMAEQCRSGNPFEEQELLIARIDQLARNEDLQACLAKCHWDLVVVDEAHKLSATYSGFEVRETKRFKLGKLLGSRTRHFLLMTATPHNGKEEDFQLFLSLLDADRFYGKFRDGVHKVDVNDLMRRMVKEDLVRFDGTPLFPERRAYTVNYRLSDREAALYEAVTAYVREEMNKADRLNGGRKGTVGFALTALQRRLASSPEAIYQSLRRRHQRLARRVEEEKLRQRGEQLAAVHQPLQARDLWDADEDLPSEEYEALEEELVDQATAAQTIAELEAEILVLQQLEEDARLVVHSNQDRKWEELSSVLQTNPDMHDADGRQRKLIIFTEHKDTLHYLADKIRGLLGVPEAVALIHGGVHRDERRRVQELFRNDPVVRILLATDAAGEGVNLQNANLMVNYDLPWNPNRLEQRFGRIHRIGQREVCHLWNMVASETREGDVFQRLLEKLETERKALGGRVFDILGDVFDDVSLKDLLMEAIRFGEQPERREALLRKVDQAMDTAHLEDILRRNALCEEVFDEKRLFAVKEEMEAAEARKLQPFFVRAFFTQAFARFGGVLRGREPGRWEITHVPASIRERDRQLAGRDRRYNEPVGRRYARVCFEKQHIYGAKAGSPRAELLHPAHPLLQALTDMVLEELRGVLKAGSILVDPTDTSETPRVVFLLDHSVKEGGAEGRVLSRRLQFVSLTREGEAAQAGWAPHLDLEPLAHEDEAAVQGILSQSWLTGELEQQALAYAAEHLAPAHYEEVRSRCLEKVEKTLHAVYERLTKEIRYWEDRALKLKEDVAAGKQPRVNYENARRQMEELQARLNSRVAELEGQKQVVSATPFVAGGMLIVPAGLLARFRGQQGFCADAAARQRVERLAMEAVFRAEKAQGCQVKDVSAIKCGWDITSQPQQVDGVWPAVRHIEVKGRVKDATTVTVTRNEILCALNQEDKFILAVVLVDGETTDGPYYIRRPFTQEPDWAETSKNLDLAQLLSRAERS